MGPGLVVVVLSGPLPPFTAGSCPMAPVSLPLPPNMPAAIVDFFHRLNHEPLAKIEKKNAGHCAKIRTRQMTTRL